MPQRCQPRVQSGVGSVSNYAIWMPFWRHRFAGIAGFVGHMQTPRELDQVDHLITAAREGDMSASLSLMRMVRSDRLGFKEQVRIVDALYDVRAAFQSRRLLFALALLCARTKAHTRARAILLDLVAADYAPAMHFLGMLLIDQGRPAAGIGLLNLARASGYRLGDVAYWRYQRRVTRGPRRGLLLLRIAAARLAYLRFQPSSEERELAVWIANPERTKL